MGGRGGGLRAFTGAQVPKTVKIAAVEAMWSGTTVRISVSKVAVAAPLPKRLGFPCKLTIFR